MTYIGEFLYRDDDPYSEPDATATVSVYECPACTALVRDVEKHRAIAHPDIRKDQI